MAKQVKIEVVVNGKALTYNPTGDGLKHHDPNGPNGDYIRAKNKSEVRWCCMAGDLVVTFGPGSPLDGQSVGASAGNWTPALQALYVNGQNNRHTYCSRVTKPGTNQVLAQDPELEVDPGAPPVGQPKKTQPKRTQPKKKATKK